MGHSQDPVHDKQYTGKKIFLWSQPFPHIIQVIVAIVINFNERVRQKETETEREREGDGVNMWQCNCGLMRNSERDSGCLCVKQAAWRRPVTLISPHHWDLLPLSLHCQCGKWDCPGWSTQRTKKPLSFSLEKCNVVSLLFMYRLSYTCNGSKWGALIKLHDIIRSLCRPLIMYTGGVL